MLVIGVPTAELFWEDRSGRPADSSPTARSTAHHFLRPRSPPTAVERALAGWLSGAGGGQLQQLAEGGPWASRLGSPGATPSRLRRHFAGRNGAGRLLGNRSCPNRPPDRGFDVSTFHRAQTYASLVVWRRAASQSGYRSFAIAAARGGRPPLPAGGGTPQARGRGRRREGPDLLVDGRGHQRGAGRWRRSDRGDWWSASPSGRNISGRAEPLAPAGTRPPAPQRLRDEAPLALTGIGGARGAREPLDGARIARASGSLRGSDRRLAWRRRANGSRSVGPPSPGGSGLVRRCRPRLNRRGPKA